MRCPQILLAMLHPDSNAVKIKDNSASCAARGPRNATSRGAGARQAVKPHVARGTDVGGTRPRIAVIVTAVAAMTVVTIVAMIVAGADEHQHKINDQTAPGVRGVDNPLHTGVGAVVDVMAACLSQRVGQHRRASRAFGPTRQLSHWCVRHSTAKTQCYVVKQLDNWSWQGAPGNAKIVFMSGYVYTHAVLRMPPINAVIAMLEILPFACSSRLRVVAM